MNKKYIIIEAINIIILKLIFNSKNKHKIKILENINDDNPSMPSIKLNAFITAKKLKIVIIIPINKFKLINDPNNYNPQQILTQSVRQHKIKMYNLTNDRGKIYQIIIRGVT